MKPFLLFFSMYFITSLFLDYKKTAKYSYIVVPEKIIKKVKTDYSFPMDIKTVNLIDFLPIDFVKDGSVDYTIAIQKAIDNHQNLIFPNFPVLINSDGLTLKNNSTLIFRENSKIIVQPNDLETYDILKIHNVKNVTLYYPRIEGDRKYHKSSSGQWGMGIGVRSSSNIKIINPNISNCWGDGIYIGQLKDVPSENIIVENGFLDFNRRNGISITSGKKVSILNTIISNTYGVGPQCGIDIEPNSFKDEIQDIKIESLTTFNNFKYGIVISLTKLSSPTSNDKEISIDLLGHKDEKSSGGLAINRIKDESNMLFFGKINIINPEWKDSRNKAFYYIKQKHGYKIELKDVRVLKISKQRIEEFDEKSMEDIKKIITN